MQNDIPDIPAEPSAEPPQPPVDPLPAAPVPPAPRSRARAWIGMGAVLAALVMLAMIPEPGAEDRDAPPPPADAPTEATDGTETAGVGAAAPLHFTLKDINGVDVKLESFKGKVILLNFWATWCAPCRVEIPDLIALQAQYANDLVILGISVDDSADKMKPYAQEMKINYPLLVGKDREDVQEAFGPMWGIPVSVFVDRDGKIHKKHSGIASREQIEREIKAAL